MTGHEHGDDQRRSERQRAEESSNTESHSVPDSEPQQDTDDTTEDEGWVESLLDSFFQFFQDRGIIDEDAEQPEISSEDLSETEIGRSLEQFDRAGQVAVESRAEGETVEEDGAETDQDSTRGQCVQTDGATEGRDVAPEHDRPVGERHADRISELHGVAREMRHLREAKREAEEEAERHEERVSNLEETLRRRKSELKQKEQEIEQFKQAQRESFEQRKQTATAAVVEQLIEDVRDPLQRAVDEEEQLTVRKGVRMTLDELDRILDEEGVTLIEPERGDPLDQDRHKVLETVDEAEAQPQTIYEVHLPGFSMGGSVQRKAEVIASNE